MATTFGKAKKSGKPRLAPRVKILPKDEPMYMKEADDKRGGKSPQAPLTRKRLSK
jgi:hypothetical protein